MTNERIEEYLETILFLTKKNKGPAKTNQIAEELNLSAPSVTEMVKKLSESGYIKYKPYYGVTLTSSGRIEALRIKRRHQLLETFLVDALGVEAAIAHKEACEMEHSISDSTLGKLCTFMGHPNICPDGNPIDHGECCPSEPSQTYRDYIPLSELKEGEGGTVKVVSLTREVKDRLSAIGLIPDQKIKVKRKLGKGTLSIIAMGAEVAVGSDIAKKILVQSERA
ncbi:MAG: winged helix-turn-helix transcriptional regulator [Nitrospirae bacterium]|nr:winged helix-turn-helix transcriptional regulator [Nitrospirota bacterium]